MKDTAPTGATPPPDARLAAGAVPLDPRLLEPQWRGLEHVRAYRVADGLWCLRLPLPYSRPATVNCYLLEGRDGWTLVDCGSATGPGWAALEHALELAGVEPDAIARLVLTHLHADHAGLAGEAVARLGCELLRLAGPDTCTDRLREPLVALDERRRLALAVGVPEAEVDLIVDAPLAGEGEHPYSAADRLLEPGDALEGGWTVLAAPGHSPAQLVLFDARRRLLLAADLAYPTGTPYVEWGFTPDPIAEHRASIARAAALGAELMLPGHGPPDPGAAARLAGSQAALDALVERVTAALGGSPYEVTCRISGDDPDPDMRQSWLSCVLCVRDHAA